MIKEWIKRQLKYSRMLQDGDAGNWESVLRAVQQKDLIEYLQLLKTQSFEGWSEDSKAGYLTAVVSIEKKIEGLLGEQ